MHFEVDLEDKMEEWDSNQSFKIYLDLKEKVEDKKDKTRLKKLY